MSTQEALFMAATKKTKSSIARLTKLMRKKRNARNYRRIKHHNRTVQKWFNLTNRLILNVSKK